MVLTNVGFSAVPINAEAVIPAKPSKYPVLLVVIIAVELVLADTPVTVSKPVVVLIFTCPVVAEPPQRNKSL